MEESFTSPSALFSRHRRTLLAGSVPLIFLCAYFCRSDGRVAEGLALGVFLWTAAVFDFHYGLIFDWLTAAMAICALAFRLCAGVGAESLALGILAGGAPLLALRVLSRGGLGGGDIKLAAAGGLWLGWQAALLALALASWSGGLFASFLLLSGRRRKGDAIAFGPFLAFGIWAAFLCGDGLLGWYEAFCCG